MYVPAHLVSRQCRDQPLLCCTHSPSLAIEHALSLAPITSPMPRQPLIHPLTYPASEQHAAHAWMLAQPLLAMCNPCLPACSTHLLCCLCAHYFLAYTLAFPHPAALMCALTCPASLGSVWPLPACLLLCPVVSLFWLWQVFPRLTLSQSSLT